MGALISGIHHVALKCNGTAEYKKHWIFIRIHWSWNRFAVGERVTLPAPCFPLGMDC